MPLTEKGKEIQSNMKKEYGPEKGESVFYASRNAGTISGVDSLKSRADLNVIRNFNQATSGQNE